MTDDKFAKLLRDAEEAAACGPLGSLRRVVDAVPALVAEVKGLTAELDQANRGGAELGKTINYLAEVMRLAAVTMTDHGPVAGMHVLFNHMAEAETLTEDEHAKAWAALQAYEAQEKRTADERAEHTRRELRDSLGSGS